MKERIRELAKQCWDERWQGQLHFDNEKFAELIIRECAKVVEKEMDYHANWCDDKILKHFGIDK